jgi:hypothetical protein
MDEVYKSCRIHTAPQLNIATDCWVPTADISWDEKGREHHQRLAGPADRFKIIDQAESYALEMAKAWIDAEYVDNLTP